MQRELLERLASLGYMARIVPIGWLEKIRQELSALAAGPYRTEGIAFLEERVREADFSALGFEAKSILVVAVPSPVCPITFDLGDRMLSTMLPPTYADYHSMNGEIGEAVKTILEPYGFHGKRTGRLPHKLLAVRSGLGRYGRNNICYVDGFGSYVNFVVFMLDVPAEDAEWLYQDNLAECGSCEACVCACPTGAITSDRPVINADRCLTLMNEQKGDFPDWLARTSHNALVGCMKCQECCPGNKKQKGFKTAGHEFNDAETQAILGHIPGDAFPEAVAEKIIRLGIKEYLEVLPRNLKALCQANRS